MGQYLKCVVLIVVMAWNMKYFSGCTGIGGFELGIQRAYNNQQSTEIEQDRQGGDRNSDEQPVLLRPTENATLCDGNKETGGCRQEEGLSKQGSRNSCSKSDKRQYPSCVGYSEIDKYAIATYQKHFGEHKNYGNIKTIDPNTIPDFDIFFAGFPCQSFSIAGQRGGFEDTRGTIFFDIARILEVKQPKMFLLENVKGLLNHDGGNTFTKILQTIDEVGYDAEWQVLNSKHFGVPQNRERVFIIGHLREESFRQVFPLGTKNETYIKEYPSICGSSQKHSAIIKGQVPCLSTAMGVGGGQIPMKFENPKVSYAIDSNYYKGTNLESYYKKKRRQLVLAPKIRRLTPIECERLQGFPDNWTIGSDTQRYKQCGNAVTVNVIEAIISKMLNTV